MLDGEWVKGQGNALALIHGWGLNRRVWSSLSAELATVCRPLLLDLPGHGGTPVEPMFNSLKAWSDAAFASVPENSIWLGWSLGGMVALQAAIEQPRKVRGLILIATNARFCQSAAWPCAVQGQVLEGFATSLELDYLGTLTRFLALQARGDVHARDTVRVLRQQLAEGGQPDPKALCAGLSILRESDLVSRLEALTCPVLLIGGEYDMLVPEAALQRMAKNIPQAQLHIIKGAAHAPFISHREACVNAIMPFLKSLSRNEVEEPQRG